jgi:hypothetical protein
VVDGLGLPELEREADTLRGEAWLHVRVPLAAPDPDLGAKVRRLLPHALKVEAELPPAPTFAGGEPLPSGTPPRALFADHLRRSELPSDPALLDAFDALLARVQQA